MTRPIRTLIQWIASNSELFYRQTWYRNESFIHTQPEDPFRLTPTRVFRRGIVPMSGTGLPLAVDLIAAYVHDPTAPVWKDWLWCRDVDRHGQRVFIGGVGENVPGQLEIHRYLHITDRWGVTT